MDLPAIKKEFSDCPCGRKHEVGINAIEIGSRITCAAGAILKRNGFEKRLLFVADKNTLAASNGLEKSLTGAGFILTKQVYENLRTSDMSNVNLIEKLLLKADGVIAVGTGSIHDICRLAAARADKMLCLFATAASMDGFASDSAPITDDNFKVTYPAKCPEVIIADTEILAAAPAILKGAGFGDMVGKYVGLIDWQVSNLITGEYYCPKVAALTKSAADRIMSLADKVQSNNQDSASAVFEALLLTGIGMAFTKTSRPASGSEHILSHYWECIKLSHGQLSDYHGRKVGVATLLILAEYEKLAARQEIKAKAEKIDWAAVYANYGVLAKEVRALNTPDTVTGGISPESLENNWQKIREIVRSVPSRAQIEKALLTAGAPVGCSEIGITGKLKTDGMKYHPYMRRRLSLMRLTPMIEM